MLITMQPTEEMYDAPINGQDVPVRIWIGMTDKNTKVEVLVLSVIATGDNDAYEQFKTELPDYMVPNRRLYAIGRFPQEKP